MFCQKCGAQNPDDGKFCNKCGNELKSTVQAERKGISSKLGKMGIPGFRSGKTWKMALATFVYFFIILVIITPSKSPDNQRSQNDLLPTPTQTPFSNPIATTTKIVATPEPTQIIVNELKQQNFSGVGKKITDEFYLQKGIAKIQMDYIGQSNFIVRLMDKDGNLIELLANEIGSWDGATAIRIDRSGYYLMDVTADGRWTVVIQN